MDYNEASDYVERIIQDLCDRSGLGDEFETIDPEIQEEITQAWIKILVEG